MCAVYALNSPKTLRVSLMVSLTYGVYVLGSTLHGMYSWSDRAPLRRSLQERRSFGFKELNAGLRHTLGGCHETMRVVSANPRA